MSVIVSVGWFGLAIGVILAFCLCLCLWNLRRLSFISSVTCLLRLVSGDSFGCCVAEINDFVGVCCGVVGDVSTAGGCGGIAPFLF